MPFLWTGLGLLILLLMTGCSNNTLPDFPPYPPADEYLQLQKRLRARPPTPPPDMSTYRRNLRAYREVEQAIVVAQAERERMLAARKRAGARRWEQVQATWDDIKTEWTGRVKLSNAFMKQREANRRRTEQRYLNRFENYQERLRRLKEQQLQTERLKASRYPWAPPLK